LHVDLFVVRMTEELTVDVPLAFTGDAPAVGKLGGTLFHAVDAIRVRALPDRLPASVAVDVGSLAGFDDAIHVRDLRVPEGATILNDGDDVVAKVLPPRVIEEEAPPAEEVAEAVAEGAAAEGEAAETRSSASERTTGEST
jgi:large subunit ribosomal protein L25